MPERVFSLQEHGVQGELRFNEKGFIRAVCRVHTGFGEHCQRQRQVTQGRSAPGRPLGALVHFLKTAENHDEQLAHCCSSIGSHSDRVAARQWFKNLPGSQEFLNLERQIEQGSDEPEEPWQMR